ncbi:MAG: ZIP family metal transporter [Candidatus Hydrogenedentes bacterium]|nr:ZIP family metal transporter [Candidatus Hydrogenedentota bacterium]
MVDWFKELHPVWQAALAGLFTWGVTAVGAMGVFFTREVNRRLFDGMLGFAAGVMLAASYWSLLAPAIEISAHRPEPDWLPALVGFLLGMGCLWASDKILPHLHPGLPADQAEGVHSALRRSILLVLAITLHNIPEGLAVGVAFGGVVAGVPSSDIGAAVALAVGIGIQNFPEGLAVALPLRASGTSRFKSFWYGQLSALVEPIAAVVGAVAVIFAEPVLPYALAFAAGAMIFVVVEELIPESQQEGNVDLATVWLSIGFGVMMTLDVALG